MPETESAGTWHHGLVARWWAELADPEPDELAYYAAAIRRFGEPALDVGCGTGRLLIPLLAEDLDVDGIDVSADMLARCAARAAGAGLTARLEQQAMHELDLGRRYRTIFVCDSFGIGGRRDRDVAALRRALHHLEPGGALVFSLELPYDGADARRWSRWLPAGRADLPTPWPESGERRTLADGDELELLTRLEGLDPLAQRRTLGIRARLWRGERIVAEEDRTLDENLYFVQEVLLMLATAGFADVVVEGRYTNLPATADDGTVVFTARAPAPTGPGAVHGA